MNTIPNTKRRHSKGGTIIGSAVIAILLIALAPTMGSAQSSGGVFAITEHTIDSGGGRSAGGVFVVTGTIGQADAQTSGSGSYVVQGGFWHGGAQLPETLFQDGFE